MSKKEYIVRISTNECKGCGRCVPACPRKVLKLGSKLNVMGYPAVITTDNVCIGCGCCFYTCPEPGALTILEVNCEQA